MSIYSRRLADFDFLTGSGLTDIFTVPVSSGPAILKWISGTLAPGGYIALGRVAAGSPFYWGKDNTLGTSLLVVTEPLWVVLEPGDTLFLFWQHDPGAGAFQGQLSGYQFATP